MNNNKNPTINIHINILSYLFIILIPSTFTGPFLPDLIISIIGIYFIFLTFKFSLYNYYNNLFSKWFAPFFLLLLISGLFSKNIYNSLINYDGAIFYFRYYFFVLGGFFILRSNKNLIKKLNFTLLATLFFVTIDAYYQFIFGYNFFGIPRLEDFQLRLSGIFGKEQVLGHYLIKLLPLSIVFLFYLNFHSKYIIFFIIYILMVSSLIIISGDRSAILLMILISISYLIIDIKRFFLKKIFFLISLILILFSIINLNPLSKQRFQQTIEEVSTTSYSFLPYAPGHEKLWINSLNLVENNYLFGIGTQLYRSECPKKQSYCATHPHNMYVQIFTENGLIGLFLFFIPFIYLLFISLRIFLSQFTNNMNKSKYPDHLVLLMILIAFNLFPIIPHANFYNNWMNSLIYLPIPFWLYFYYQMKN